MNSTNPFRGDDDDSGGDDDDSSTMMLLAESSFEEDYEAYYINNNKIDNNINNNSKNCGGSRRGKASNKQRNLDLGRVRLMQVSFFFFLINYLLLTHYTTFYAYVVHVFRITLQGIVMAFTPTTTATFVVVSGCARLCSSASGNEFRVGTHSLFNGATRLVNLARHHTRRLLLLSVCLHTEQVLINLMTASG